MRVVPEGPLHPELAVGGLLVGVALAVMLRALPPVRRWWGLPMATVAAFGVLTATRQAPWSVRGLSAGEVGVGVVVGVVAAVALVVQARVSWRAALVTVGAAAAAAWATVPDTEPLVVVGAVLAPVVVTGLVRVVDGGPPAGRAVPVAAAAGAAVAGFGVVLAAVTGNRGGRPGQLVPTALVVVGAAVVTAVAGRVRSRRRLR